MLAEARRKLVEHEMISRANEGKSQFPLSLKLKVALPLAGLAAVLFAYSFHHAKKRWNSTDLDGLKTVLDSRNTTDQEDRIGSRDSVMQQSDALDNQEFLSDDDKRW